MADRRCSSSAVAQRQAADWFALLSSGEATETERQQWRAWCSDAPEHSVAWAQVEEVVSRFQGLPSALAQATLDTPTLDRRAALKLLTTLLAVGGATAAGMHTDLYVRTFADLATRSGERREWRLADGTRLHLNACSAADVTVDEHHCRVRVHRGEFMFTTDPSAFAQHSLLVETGQGLIEAHSARFMVSRRNDATEVSLFAGALQIRSRSGQSLSLTPGQAAHIQGGRPISVQAQDPQVGAWEQGLIFAEGMRLERYLAQLMAYRAGVLSCDAAAGRLRVSGVFALNESDRLLAQLPDILPVRVRYFSRYWVRVEAT